MSNVKVMIICLLAGLIKKTLYKIRHRHFPKLYNRFGGNVKVELDLSNYARKGNWKRASGNDAPNFTSKSN